MSDLESVKGGGPHEQDSSIGRWLDACGQRWRLAQVIYVQGLKQMPPQGCGLCNQMNLGLTLVLSTSAESPDP